MTDDQHLTGAQFRRLVGVDAERWAEQFLVAYARVEPAERHAFVVGWVRDAMKAAVARADREALTAAIRRDMAGGDADG